MTDNPIAKIMTALLKHQIKKMVGDETLEVISEEFAEIGVDRIEQWLGERETQEKIEKAAVSAKDKFQKQVQDEEIEQWMEMMPIHNLPDVISAIEELPNCPDENKLETALRGSISQVWKNLTPNQVDKVVDSFLSCLRIELLPIKDQYPMVIGRSILRTEEKVDRLNRQIDQLVKRENSFEPDHLLIETVDRWRIVHPYAISPDFTGRLEERKLLSEWLDPGNKIRLLIIQALGGFGKSALAWYWLTHDVSAEKWPRVFWWSFYEGEASFEHFLEEALVYLRVKVPEGQRTQVGELLKALEAQTCLLILDGFERVLRAFSDMNAAYLGDEEKTNIENNRDCVNVNADFFLRSLCALPNIKGKVLMTSRLTPRAIETRGQLLQGCRIEELKAMRKEDAVLFFHNLGIRATHTEIVTVCESYGFHPLSLRILTGLIVSDRENPKDIKSVERLDITDNIIANKNHILKVAYDSLSDEQQKLLSTIACFRSSVTFGYLKSVVSGGDDLNQGGDKHEISMFSKPSLANRPNVVLDENLKVLETLGLLHWDKERNSYDQHPIVRRYAYERMTSTDRLAAHTRLHDYFAAVPITGDPQNVSELNPVIELFHHCIHAGYYYEAYSIFRNRLNSLLYVKYGEYILCIELLEGLLSEEIDSLSERDPHAPSWLLNKLALCYSRTGRSHEAESTFRKNIRIREKMNFLSGVMVGLGNLSEILIRTGQLKEATQLLERKISIARETSDVLKEMAGRQDYGLVLAYRSHFEKAEEQLTTTIEWFSKRSRPREESVSWAFYTIMKLLQGHIEGAVTSSKRAYDLAESEDRNRDIVRAKWLIGLANLQAGRISDSAPFLENALIECRQINLLEFEPNILLGLASLNYIQKNYEEAQALAEEALSIAERCDYVLQSADIKIFLAQFVLEQKQDQVAAKKYAESAMKLAYCDGPSYEYKVAKQKGEIILSQLFDK